MPVCIFLASKVEENYIRADEICEKLQGNVQDVREFEMKVLEELKFDVRIFHPEGCLDALIADYYKYEATCENRTVDRDNLLAEAPSKSNHGSDALRRRIKRARRNLKLLTTTSCSLIAPPAFTAMVVITEDTTEDGEQLSEFLSYVKSRLGVPVLQAFENKKQEIIAFLNEAKTNIDTEKVRKVTKKLFKASIWKGK